MKMLNLIESLERFGMNSEGCKRMQLLCEELGNPQNKLKFIHVGGTNGKGSTCHMLASILKEQGYKVGVYISPALFKFNERITVNNRYIQDEEMEKYYPVFTETLKKFINHPLGYPTEFEVVTALAFMYFKDEEADYVVLEVGLGGRFDATNVVTPLVSAITNIDLDHTQVLGDTVEEIAFEKAGIIKEGIPTVIGFTDPSSTNVIQNEAQKRNSKVYFAKDVSVKGETDTVNGQQIIYNNEKMKLALLGKHQLENVKIVLKIIEVLKEQNVQISLNSIRGGLEKASWPGRFEIIEYRDKKIIFDVAHNPNSMEMLKNNLENYFNGQSITVVLGIFKDKDIETMVGYLQDLDAHIYLTKPYGDRGMPAEELDAVVKSMELNILGKNDDLLAAFEESLESTDKIICICGSFNTVGPIRNYVMKESK